MIHATHNPNPEEESQCDFLTKNKAQALDWALVLASQSIKVWLPYPVGGAGESQHQQQQQQEEGRAPGWRVSVGLEDQEIAEQVLSTYISENPDFDYLSQSTTSSSGARSSRQAQEWIELFRGVSSLMWITFLAAFYWFQQHSKWPVLELGKFDSVKAIGGEWTRFLSSPFLHSSLEHFASNAGIGFIWMGLAMARFGDGWTLFGVWLCGAAGNALGLALYPDPYSSVGASGSVFGALGMLTGQAFFYDPNQPGKRFVIKIGQGGRGRKSVEEEGASELPGMKTAINAAPVSFWRSRRFRIAFSALSGGALMFSLFGMSLESDWVAHLGGFIFGIFWGAVGAVFLAGRGQSEFSQTMGWLSWITAVLFVWKWALGV